MKRRRDFRGYLGHALPRGERGKFAARIYTEKQPIDGPFTYDPPIKAPTLQQLAFAYGTTVARIQRELRGLAAVQVTN
jgi:hypothetical protein